MKDTNKEVTWQQALSYALSNSTAIESTDLHSFGDVAVSFKGWTKAMMQAFIEAKAAGMKRHGFRSKSIPKYLDLFTKLDNTSGYSGPTIIQPSCMSDADIKASDDQSIMDAQLKRQRKNDKRIRDHRRSIKNYNRLHAAV